MKCVVPSQNVKILGRGIHSLAKIGEELYIEPNDNVLTFCTVSVSQSALAEFNMSSSSFFSSYIFGEEDRDNKCKVAMKSCLNVFRSSHHFEKNVESCEMRLKPDANVVIFFIKFTNATTRKYFLPIIDSEKVEVNYEKNVPNKFVCSSKLLGSSIKNFRASEDEITIKVSSNKMIIKNHLELRRDRSLMRTEVCFEPTEFDCYQAQTEGAVTFCLKEFRSAIGFAEPAALPVTLFLNIAGQPIIIQVANQPAFEMSYVIATLKPSLMEADATIASASSAAPSEPQRQGSTPSATTSHPHSNLDPSPSRRLSSGFTNPLQTVSQKLSSAAVVQQEEQVSKKFSGNSAMILQQADLASQRVSSSSSAIPDTANQVSSIPHVTILPGVPQVVPETPASEVSSENMAKSAYNQEELSSHGMFSHSFTNIPEGVILETPDELLPSSPASSHNQILCNQGNDPDVLSLIFTVFQRCFVPPSLSLSPSAILADQSDSE